MARQKKKPKTEKAPPQQRKLLQRDEFSLHNEVRYVIECALRQDSRVVSISGLILFSTENGDAWLLDPEDKLALCLAEKGQVLPYNIMETGTNFTIKWQGNYAIDKDTFIVEYNPGTIRVDTGYPTKEILAAEKRINS
jgi:hypothetical protein